MPDHAAGAPHDPSPNRDLLLIPLAVVPLEPDPGGTAGGDLFGPGPADGFRGGAGLLGESGIDDLAVPIFTGDNIARRRTRFPEFDEATVVFADGALRFELIELAQALRHPGLDGAQILGRPHVGSGRETQADDNKQAKKCGFHGGRS